LNELATDQNGCASFDHLSVGKAAAHLGLDLSEEQAMSCTSLPHTENKLNHNFLPVNDNLIVWNYQISFVATLEIFNVKQ
jgi:hypothetical protein